MEMSLFGEHNIIILLNDVLISDQTNKAAYPQCKSEVTHFIILKKS